MVFLKIKNYFIIEFDKPFTYKATVENGNLQENVAEQMTDHAGAIIDSKPAKGTDECTYRLFFYQL